MRASAAHRAPPPSRPIGFEQTGAEYKEAWRSNNRQTLEMANSTGAGAPGSTTEDIEAFFAGLPQRTALIGIDAGTKTLGLALSDITRTIASPLTVIRRTKFKEDAAELLRAAAEHKISGFVLGLPTNLDGTYGPRVQATRAFARNLNALSALPILLWDERLSTAAAERTLLEADASRRRRAEVIDKLAAAIILQGALDRMRGLQS
jgi:putative Holliday junction resolvase